jgi:hypothetical protein
VPIEQRARIEERDVVGVLVDDRRRQVAGDDLAEDAVGNAREASRSIPGMSGLPSLVRLKE